MIMLKDAGKIATKGAYLELDGFDTKFRTRDFKEFFTEREDFRMHFLRLARDVMDELIAPVPTSGQVTNASITKDLIASFKALEA